MNLFVNPMLSILFALGLTATLCGQTAPAPVPTRGLGNAGQNPLVNGPQNYRPAPTGYYRNQVPTVRIKDVTYIDGDRPNHVSGVGLVFGLSGTGGKAEQTRLMAKNYFDRQRIRAGKIDTRNMAAVQVSGEIPPHARKGETIKVLVSVADDSSSLRGGTLNLTALRGQDDEIYAIAQGPIVSFGVSAGGAAASAQLNHPNAGFCDAIVEREISIDRMIGQGPIRLILLNKDYTTATHIANALNSVFPGCSRPLDSGTVEIVVPRNFQSSLPAFISMIGDLRIVPDMTAKVVINQKSGTIVMGQNVRISKVSFASANIIISTSESPQVSQPAPFSGGETVQVPRTDVNVVDTGGSYNNLPDGITVGELASVLNALAVSPTTMIELFGSLRKQGALQAELVIE